MKITICGSTRFIEQFHSWNRYLTLLGHVVYSVSTSVKHDYGPTEKEKTTLDLVHLAKIEESEYILVITSRAEPEELVPDDANPRVDAIVPYIGESTAREIQWAHIREKVVFYTHQDLTNVFGQRKILGKTQGDK